MMKVHPLLNQKVIYSRHINKCRFSPACGKDVVKTLLSTLTWLVKTWSHVVIHVVQVSQSGGRPLLLLASLHIILPHSQILVAWIRRLRPLQ
nr:hypothetical protein [Cressdnaviricota sp.]